VGSGDYSVPNPIRQAGISLTWIKAAA
jgi:hypothetical protein